MQAESEGDGFSGGAASRENGAREFHFSRLKRRYVAWDQKGGKVRDGVRGQGY